ncbi:MAG: phosphoribosylanthranilate isomerase [Pseudomonadota bacterium]
MARTRIKICCIGSAEEAELASRAGADLLGLVGPMLSGPGTLELSKAARIAERAPPWSRPVLLTASETADQILRDAETAGVGAVQVVRHIAPSEAERLGRLPLLYIQVLHVTGAECMDLIPLYSPHCDAFLLDSGRPEAAVLGGTGDPHDWALSAEIVRRAPCPVFLAGGLDPANVARAIRQVRPFGVDVCSRLRPGGALSPDLLSGFVEAVGGALGEAA